jgi:hypothetical protein
MRVVPWEWSHSESGQLLLGGMSQVQLLTLSAQSPLGGPALRAHFQHLQEGGGLHCLQQ